MPKIFWMSPPSGNSPAPAGGSLLLAAATALLSFGLAAQPAALGLTGSTPIVAVGPVVVPTAGTLTLTGGTPRMGSPMLAAGGTSATLSGGQPTLALGYPATKGSLALTGGTSSFPSTVPWAQRVISSANPAGIGISGNNFKIPLPNKVGAGNCLALFLTYPHGSPPTSITDTDGNSWSTTAAISKDNGSGAYIAGCFVLANAAGGTSANVITVGFGTDIIPFQYDVFELYGIATTSPVNGSVGAIGAAAPSLACGSFTPTNNDANGGNVVLAYYGLAAGASDNPSSWVPGGSFALVEGDIVWTSNNGVPHAAMGWVQGSSASINPSITATSDTGNHYNCLAVALKIDTTKGTKPGNGIVSVIHQTQSTPTTPLLTHVPSQGNLLVMQTIPSEFYDITSITDSKGNTWTQDAVLSAHGDAQQIWYAQNAITGPDLVVTINFSGSSPTTTLVWYDVVGALASAFDKAAYKASENVNGLTTCSGPSITPATANGLVFFGLGLGQGPGLSITSPSGAVFDLTTYTDELDLDLMENADGKAHFYNPSTSAVTAAWTMSSQPSNTAYHAAAAFKLQSTGSGTMLSPTGASLALTSATPIEALGLPSSAGSLSLAGQTPSLSISTTRAPAAATLALTAGASFEGLGLPASSGALVLTGATPTLTISGALTPAGASLVMAAGTPTTGLGVLPSAGGLSLAAATPSLSLGTVRAPAATSLTLTTGTPLETFGLPAIATAVTLTGGTPSVTISGALIPSPGVLALTGAPPALALGENASGATLALAGKTPSLLVGGALNPAGASLALVGSASTVRLGLNPTSATLGLSAATPSLAIGTLRVPAGTAAALSSSTPSVGTTVSPLGASLGLSPAAPSQALGLHASPGALALSGKTPAVVFGALYPAPAVLALSAATPMFGTSIGPAVLWFTNEAFLS